MNGINQNNNSNMDANNYYNWGNNSLCANGNCIANTAQEANSTIPSLQEIASYNQPTFSGNTPQTPNIYAGSLQSIPAVSELETIDNMNSQPIPESLQTPATVLNYGATADNGLKMATNNQISDFQNPYPITTESIQYLNGFIRTQIGRRVTIDFLIGSGQIVSKSGYLLGVAANYIVLNELDTNDITTCDFYNIKFIRFYY